MAKVISGGAATVKCGQYSYLTTLVVEEAHQVGSGDSAVDVPDRVVAMVVDSHLVDRVLNSLDGDEVGCSWCGSSIGFTIGAPGVLEAMRAHTATCSAFPTDAGMRKLLRDIVVGWDHADAGAFDSIVENARDVVGDRPMHRPYVEANEAMRSLLRDFVLTWRAAMKTTSMALSAEDAFDALEERAVALVGDPMVSDAGEAKEALVVVGMDIARPGADHTATFTPDVDYPILAEAPRLFPLKDSILIKGMGEREAVRAIPVEDPAKPKS